MFETIWEKKFSFLFAYFVVFLLTYLLLVAIDFVPEPKTSEPVEVEETAVIEEAIEQSIITEEVVEEVVVETVLPTQIYIKKLDKSIEVLNPNSRSIADLDEALLYGAVRHPDSAHLMQDGNVFILGHSSYLPNVLNKNFQAFNGIQNLEWGDVIEVSSDGQVFVYRVEKVFKASAQEVTVPIAGDEKLLTIATCNSFGTADDRYIVEAKQVEVRGTWQNRLY